MPFLLANSYSSCLLSSNGELDTIGELFSDMAGQRLPLYATCDILGISWKDLNQGREEYCLPFVTKEVFGEIRLISVLLSLQQ